MGNSKKVFAVFAYGKNGEFTKNDKPFLVEVFKKYESAKKYVDEMYRFKLFWNLVIDECNLTDLTRRKK